MGRAGPGSTAPGRNRSCGSPWCPSTWLALLDASSRGSRGAGAPCGAPGLTLPDPDEALPPVAKGDLDEVLVVEVGPVVEAVVGALHAHATQVHHVGIEPGGAGAAGVVLGWYALSNNVLAALPSREFYSVTPESAAGSRRFTGYDQAGPVAWTP
ncbi:hypothetical protein NKG05_23410 [Oerskovia sp. M15]